DRFSLHHRHVRRHFRRHRSQKNQLVILYKSQPFAAQICRWYRPKTSRNNRIFRKPSAARSHTSGNQILRSWYFDHAYAAGGTLSRSSSVGLLGHCQNFGRKSWSLVSGPGIGVMLITRRDSSQFPRKFGAGPVI
ncbi:unnamed protein product, partial [Prunus brigantina]